MPANLLISHHRIFRPSYGPNVVSYFWEIFSKQGRVKHVRIEVKSWIVLKWNWKHEATFLLIFVTNKCFFQNKFMHSPKTWKMDLRFGFIHKLKTFWHVQECCFMFLVQPKKTVQVYCTEKVYLIIIRTSEKERPVKILILLIQK